MKKYLFGVFAIALAVMFSAFKGQQTDPIMKFQGGQEATTLLQLQNPDNWLQDGPDPDGYTCNTGSDATCQFAVDENAEIVENGVFIDGVIITFSGGVASAPTVEYNLSQVTVSSHQPAALD